MLKIAVGSLKLGNLKRKRNESSSAQDATITDNQNTDSDSSTVQDSQHAGNTQTIDSDYGSAQDVHLTSDTTIHGTANTDGDSCSTQDLGNTTYKTLNCDSDCGAGQSTVDDKQNNANIQVKTAGNDSGSVLYAQHVGNRAIHDTLNTDCHSSTVQDSQHANNTAGNDTLNSDAAQNSQHAINTTDSYSGVTQDTVDNTENITNELAPIEDMEEQCSADCET